MKTRKRIVSLLERIAVALEAMRPVLPAAESAPSALLSRSAAQAPEPSAGERPVGSEQGNSGNSSDFGGTVQKSQGTPAVAPEVSGVALHPADQDSTQASSQPDLGYTSEGEGQASGDSVPPPAPPAEPLPFDGSCDDRPAEKPKRTRRPCKITGCQAIHRHSHKEGVFMPAGFVAANPELGSLGAWLLKPTTEGDQKKEAPF